MYNRFRSKTRLGIIGAMMGLTFALYACDEADGPVEQVGEQVDKAVEETGDAVENAADQAEDATNQ